MTTLFKALVAFLMGSTALASPLGEADGEILARALKLSKAQTEQVKKINEKYIAKINEGHGAYIKAKEELVKDLQVARRGVEYDKVLAEKFDRIQTLKLSFQKLRFEMALEIRSTLTDEQIKKFETLKKRESK